MSDEVNASGCCGGTARGSGRKTGELSQARPFHDLIISGKSGERKTSIRDLAGFGAPASGAAEARADAEPVAARITRSDRREALLARLGVRRMDHRVKPGLYALDGPGADSPVFATANYRLSFDALRSGLSGIPSWILVLDTRGINVWCAAGKGTFGTRELVRTMRSADIAGRVSHRRIVLPQLGAPGVNSPEVERETGFSVVYGPVRARDIRAFVEAGYRKTLGMSRVSFGLAERAVLVPVEIRGAFKAILAFLGASILLGSMTLIGAPAETLSILLSGFAVKSAAIALVLCGAVITGSALFPLLLPILPGKPLSLKGGFLGLLYAGILSWLLGFGWIPAGAMSLMCVGIVGFSALLFTGSTTFTSQSGTERDLRKFGPVLAGSFLVGTGAYIAAALGGIV